MGVRTIPQSNSPVLQSGKFRHRIQIVKPSAAQDSMGGWSTDVNSIILTTWGTVETISGSEKYAAHEFSNNASHFIYIRHPRSKVPGGILPNMQVWFDTRQFQIESVQDPDERRKMLQLVCVEIDSSLNQTKNIPAERDI